MSGEGFSGWLEGFKSEAAAAGISAGAISALDGVSYDQKVINADRRQGVFAQSFLEFAGRMVADYRMSQGKSQLKKYAATFKSIEQEFGVPGPVIVAFWGLETDFGANLGDFRTLQSLATLAYDCRRPEQFTPELFAALKILDSGDLTAGEMQGAWAGEIGQTQFVPAYYFDFAVDYDGDGKRNLVKSVPDVLASSANLLKHHGWQAGQPWLEEVRAPADMPWAEADLAIKHARSEWAAWGVTMADGKRAAGRQRTGGAAPADGPARAGVPRLREFRRLHAVEPVARLRDDCRLFRDAARRRGGLEAAPRMPRAASRCRRCKRIAGARLRRR